MQLDDRRQITFVCRFREDDIGLQGKKTRLHENSYIDKCLCYKYILLLY
jgi:hypothetical protein